MMHLQGLCRDCDQVDVEMRFNGAQYREQRVCLYDMQLFPKAQKCDKYLPRQSPEEKAA